MFNDGAVSDGLTSLNGSGTAAAGDYIGASELIDTPTATDMFHAPGNENNTVCGYNRELGIINSDTNTWWDAKVGSFGTLSWKNDGATDATEVYVDMQFTEDGSTFTTHSRAVGGGERFNYNGFFGQALVDVTNTSNVKMRLRVYSSVGSSTLQGSTSANRTYLSFIKLGDT